MRSPVCWPPRVRLCLAGSALALTLACGSDPKYCATIDVLEQPVSAYPATTLTLQAGVPVVVQPVTTSHGPISTSTLTTGALPPGLALLADGTLSGTPTQPGVYPMTLTLGNAAGGLLPCDLRVVVTPAQPLGLAYATPMAFPSGTTIAPQLPVSQSPTPGLPTTYALAGGGLPAGLTLDLASGAITGTPTLAGAYAFTVTATNGTRTAQASAVYTIVQLATLAFTLPSPEAFPEGIPIPPQVLTLSNAVPGLPATYAVTSGTLPSGLNLNADGTLTGTPDTPGTSNFTVTATQGAQAASASASYTIGQPAPGLLYAPLTTTLGTPLTDRPLTTGGSFTATQTGGALPPGTALDPATGVITGTPVAAGVYTSRITLCPLTASSSSLARVSRASALAASVCAIGTATLTVNPPDLAPFAATYANAAGTAGMPLATIAPVLSVGGPVVGATLTDGDLPPGVTLDSAQGILTGTPALAGCFPVTITLKDPSGGLSTAPLILTVSSSGATPLAATYGPVAGTAGTPLTASPALTTGGPVTGAALMGGGLPPGVHLDPSTGDLGGTPSTAGTYAARILLDNASGGEATVEAILTINAAAVDPQVPAVLMSASYPDQTLTQGVPMAVQSCAVQNGTPGAAATFLLASGSLPPGLALNTPAPGQIAGTPVTPGTYTFTVTATSGTLNATTATVTYTVEPPPPQLIYPVLTTTQGTPILLTPVHGGGPIASASLPAGAVPGMALTASTGVLAGTPTTPGVYTTQVTACGAGGACLTSPLILTVTPSGADVLSASYPDAAGTVNAPLAPILPALTVGGPLTQATLTSGALGAGVSLDPVTGSITGVPTATGAFPVLITLANASGGQVTLPFTLTVSAAGATPLAAAYPDAPGILNSPFTLSPAVTSGGPVTAAALAGTDSVLPAGLSLDAQTGVIAGLPSATGTYAARVDLVNASGGRVTAPVTFTVNTTAEPLVAAYGTFTGTMGPDFQTITPAVTRGGPITSASLLSGGLPSGLTLDPGTGTITGAATAPGTFMLSLRLVSATGASTDQLLTLILLPSLPNLSYGSPVVDVGAALTLVPNNAGGPVTRATLASGTLPPGLQLKADGSLTGSPTVAGIYPLAIQCCNETGCSTSPTFTLYANPVAPMTVAYLDQNLTQGVDAGAGFQPSSVTNDTLGEAITFALAGGSLPPGLSLAASGAITGTPTQTGSFPFTIRASSVDGSGNVSRSATSDTITYAVLAPAPKGVYPVLTTTLDTPVTVAPLDSGGPIASASLTDGALPPGMALNASTGLVSGQPSGKAGVFTAQITLCNATGQCATAPLTLTVNPAGATPLTANYAAANDVSGTAGEDLMALAYNLPAVTGGAPITSAALTDGTLPRGVSLDPSTGALLGTPPAAGAFPVLITLGNGPSGLLTLFRILTVDAQGGQPLGATYEDAAGLVGTPLTVTPSGEASAVTGASLTAGSLPWGIALDPATGNLTGTPLATGTYTAYITLESATGSRLTRPITLTINSGSPQLTVTVLDAVGILAGTKDAPLTITPTANSGGPITTATMVDGSLPPGLALDPGTGVISGTPTASGTYMAEIQYGSASGACTVKTLTLAIKP